MFKQILVCNHCNKEITFGTRFYTLSQRKHEDPDAASSTLEHFIPPKDEHYHVDCFDLYCRPFKFGTISAGKIQCHSFHTSELAGDMISAEPITVDAITPSHIKPGCITEKNIRSAIDGGLITKGAIEEILKLYPSKREDDTDGNHK
jgi:hypothetical protein